MIQYSAFIFLVILTMINYVTASALWGPCDGDEDCGTIDTFCKNGQCLCKENFTVFYDSCVQIAIPKISCTKKKKHECHKILGTRSTCTEGLCACKAFHHIYNGQCVKNRDLHDICEHDHQCYCGEDCQEKIACLGYNCTCKLGNIPYRSRRCISDPMFILPSEEIPKTTSAAKTGTFSSTVLLLMFLILITFK